MAAGAAAGLGTVTGFGALGVVEGLVAVAGFATPSVTGFGGGGGGGGGIIEATLFRQESIDPAITSATLFW